MNLGGLFSGWVGVLLGGVAVAAVAAVTWVFILPPKPNEAPPPADVVAVPPPPPPAAEPAPEPAPEPAEPEPARDPEPAEPAPVAEAQPATPDASATPEPPAPAAAPILPGFDVVRITPDGNALVAGQAEPGAAITVFVDGTGVAETEADGGANFVALFDLPPSGLDRVMTLQAKLSDGTVLASEMSVIVEGVEMPPEVVAMAEPAPEPTPATAPEPEVAPAAEPAPAPEPDAPQTVEAPQPPAATEPTTEPTTEPAAAEPEPAPEPQLAENAAPEPEPAPAPAPQQPAAPRILLAGPDGVQVLQDPGPQPQLSIDAISYTDAGEVALAGRGQGADTLQIYLDNAPVGTAEIGAGGQWRAPLPDVAAGVYTLRVDSVSPEGNVTSRVETPFKREEPAVLAAAGEKAATAWAEGRQLTAITVQPGNTLWAIAEGRYGEGVAYWKIFEANRDQIRDPDWIYPGQVFTLPGAAE